MIELVWIWNSQKQTSPQWNIWANYNDVSPRHTLNGGLIRELPQNPLNSGLGIILICPETYGRCNPFVRRMITSMKFCTSSPTKTTTLKLRWNVPLSGRACERVHALKVFCSATIDRVDGGVACTTVVPCYVVGICKHHILCKCV